MKHRVSWLGTVAALGMAALAVGTPQSSHRERGATGATAPPPQAAMPLRLSVELGADASLLAYSLGPGIGFFADGKLKKIGVGGGAPVTLCDAGNARGGSWAEDGTILFTAAPRAALLRVPSAGGSPEPLTRLDTATGEVTHRWPQALLGGKAVLFTAHSRTHDFEDANIVVQSLPDGRRKVVQQGGYHGRYLESGHLAYMRGGTLFTASFDLGRLELTGQPVRALEGVAGLSEAGGANFAFSSRGALAFVPGQGIGATPMVTAYATEGDSFRAAKPQQAGRIPRRGLAFQGFDLHPGGQRC